MQSPLINWQDIDLVLLDMDGTLLDLNFDMQFWLQLIPQKYGELHGMTRDEAWQIILPKMQAVQGTLKWYSVDYWSRTLNLDVLALNHELTHLVRPRLDAIDFLQALQNAQIPAWLATNASPKTIDIKMQKVNLTPYLQRIVSSHEIGAAKESDDFWQGLFAMHSVDPSRCLFIDDSASVLQSAANFGVGHLLTIDQPDLSQSPREPNGYRSIANFNGIFPPDGSSKYEH